MSDIPRNRILLVDDEPSIREALTMLLNEGGYDVATAVHGFDALLRLKATTPDVIISDLNMPQMSGFEFLAVLRRRFPAIPVIAMSGDYSSGDRFPGGVIADAFYAKGQSHPEELLYVVAELIQTRVARTTSRRQPAFVQMPRYGRNSRGASFVLLTCTECLRSFSLSVMQEVLPEIQEAHCEFCATAVRYVSGFPLLVVSPGALAVYRQAAYQ
jgi:CheY-like chemotaxis protein